MINNDLYHENFSILTQTAPHMHGYFQINFNLIQISSFQFSISIFHPQFIPLVSDSQSELLLKQYFECFLVLTYFAIQKQLVLV